MLRFNDCRLDLGTRQLFCRDREVHLSPKAFEMLRALIERRPAAVSKDELFALIWPGTFVSDSSLARVVSEVRRAFGDAARGPQLIRTVHGFGYAFCGEVSEEGRPTPSPSAMACCWIVLGGRETPLAEGAHLVGRDLEASVRLDWPTVSRRHARIDVSGGEAKLQDLGSKNGTYLHGARVSDVASLADGDQIRFGSVEVVFRSRRPNAVLTQSLWNGPQVTGHRP